MHNISEKWQDQISLQGKHQKHFSAPEEKQVCLAERGLR